MASSSWVISLLIGNPLAIGAVELEWLFLQGIMAFCVAVVVSIGFEDLRRGGDDDE